MSSCSREMPEGLLDAIPLTKWGAGCAYSIRTWQQDQRRRQDRIERVFERVLEATAARLLRPGGWVGAEHADVQGDAAPAVFVSAGRWADVRDHRDLAGRPRYLTARLAR